MEKKCPDFAIKVSWFWKKVPCVYICGLNSHLKCSFKRVLEKKHQNFSLRSPSFAVHEKFIEMPLFQKTSPSPKMSWLRTCIWKFITLVLTETTTWSYQDYDWKIAVSEILLFLGDHFHASHPTRIWQWSQEDSWDLKCYGVLQGPEGSKRRVQGVPGGSVVLKNLGGSQVSWGPGSRSNSPTIPLISHISFLRFIKRSSHKYIKGSKHKRRSKKADDFFKTKIHDFPQWTLTLKMCPEQNVYGINSYLKM